MNYFEMYQDVWQFHKKYIGGVREDADYWEAMVNEFGVISRKYNRCKFVVDLLLVEVAEFERIYKEMKLNAHC